MDRWQHKIKLNKGGEFPYRFIFFDCETTSHDISDDSIEHELNFGIALYWERAHGDRAEILNYHTFRTPRSFWDFVYSHCQPKSRIVIISHNLPFDMGAVKGWHALQASGFKVTKLIIDFKCNIWRFRRDTTTLLLLDNMNYFDSSLASLGDSLGLKKMIMPVPLASQQEWYVYCKRDVDILLLSWQTWYKFLSDNELGAFGLTMASQAFNAFRHRFMQHDIFVHDSDKAVRLERLSYRGGRNECLRIGKCPQQDYYLLDVNSMYPYVMHNYEYPVNLTNTGRKLTLTKLAKILETKAIVAECLIRTKQAAYGTKSDGKLVFPIGTFWVVLTTNEIRRALKRDEIIAIGNHSLYDKANIFREYVEFFYSARLDFEKSGMPAFAYLCKRMLNSLYGKFGQRSQEWEYVRDDEYIEYGTWQEYNHQTRQTLTFRCINYRVEVCIGLTEGFNSLVAVASEVTANARLLLFDLVATAGTNHCYYMDTDSLIVDHTGYTRLVKYIHPNRLGALKLEKQTQHLIINNLKDYELGEMVKLKGVRKNAEKLDELTYKQWQSVGIKSGLKRQDINRVIWKAVVKHLSGKYTKGIVHSNGTVTPLVFCETAADKSRLYPSQNPTL